VTQPADPRKRRLLLIGWDAADWRIIRPLLKAGRMPNLEALMSWGAHGNLETLNPPLSPMLWTSIATGKRPFKHGIHGFTEPDPQTGLIRPISSLSRKTKAFWNILTQKGRKVNVIGWWPSHPAESINGTMVSNHFQTATAPLDKPWPLKGGAVHPLEEAGKLAALRVHPGELPAEALLPFIPGAVGKDLSGENRINALAKITAECATIQAVATEVMESADWDCTAVYFDGIDHYGHGFMRFHPPRRPHIDERQFELYQNVMTAAYQFHDSMLGVLVAKAGPGTTVMLLSDHGFHPDALRPTSIPAIPAGPAAEHRNLGIFVMAGPGIKVNEPVYGANLLDICPTLLTFLGLPVGRDMDGRPLNQLFENASAPQQIDSWDEVEGEDGRLKEAASLSPDETRQALQQLVDLGYIEDSEGNQKEAVDRTVRELRFNLAYSYLDANRFAEADKIFRELYDENPGDYRFGLRHISCLKAMGRNDEALETIEAVLEHKRKATAKARKELSELKKKVADKKVDPTKFTRAQQKRFRRLKAEAGVSEVTLNLLRASALEAKGRIHEALEILDGIRESHAANLVVLLQSAALYNRQKAHSKAEEILQHALTVDAEDASVRSGLAETYLAMKFNYNAAAEALKAAELRYFNPKAHFFLGIALHRLGHLEPALEALQLALSQNPLFTEAHQRLAYIYGKRIKDPAKAAFHKEQARIARKRLMAIRRGRGYVSPAEVIGEASADTTAETPFAWVRDSQLRPPDDPQSVITLVSGLPRSGTSLMMQMLEAAGLPPLTDLNRAADDNNPRGYYEFEPVKRLGRESVDWLDRAKGKALKVVAQLLLRLPPGYPYRVIFMQRDLDEVVLSQQGMLGRLHRKGAELSPERLRATFAGHLLMVSRWLKEQDIPVLTLDHAECLARPEQIADRLGSFIGRAVDPRRISGTVDPALYRSRVESAGRER